MFYRMLPAFSRSSSHQQSPVQKDDIVNLGGNELTEKLDSVPVHSSHFLAIGRCKSTKNDDDWRCEMQKDDCFLPNAPNQGENWESAWMAKSNNDFVCSCANTMIGACWEKQSVNNTKPQFRCAAHAGLCNPETEVFGDITGSDLELEDHCYCGQNAKVPTFYGACRTRESAERQSGALLDVDFYCAYAKSDCPLDTHLFLNPLQVDTVLGSSCQCHQVRIGGCMHKTQVGNVGGGVQSNEIQFSCAATFDDCKGLGDDYVFVDPYTLVKEHDRTCHLCAPPGHDASRDTYKYIEGLRRDELNKVMEEEENTALLVGALIGSMVGSAVLGFLIYLGVVIYRNRNTTSTRRANGTTIKASGTGDTEDQVEI